MSVNSNSKYKLGFISDTVLLEDSFNGYYSIKFGYDLWRERYLPVFETVAFCARTRNAGGGVEGGYDCVDKKGVTVFPMTRYNSVLDALTKKTQITRQLTEIISQCNRIIVRLPSPLGSLACQVCQKMRKPYMIELVADAYDIFKYHTNPMGRLIAPWIHLSTKKECRRAPYVLYVTSEYLQKKYPTDGKSVGVSDVIIKSSSKDVLEKRLKKIDDSRGTKIKLGLVGKLDYAVKGHAVALEALSILQRIYPDVVIEFVGDGDKSNIKRAAEKLKIRNGTIIFRGTLKGGKEMVDWLDDIDILLIPSRTEGLPRILVEAMGRACPVIGSRVGGIPELIEDKWLHNSKNPRQLASILQKIISDQRILKDMATRNYRESLKFTGVALNGVRNAFLLEFVNDEGANDG